MKNKITVAAKAIIRKGDHFLILHRSDVEEINPQGADIPGGKIEFGEKVEEGLHREVMEESNLKIEIIRPLRAWSFLKNKNVQIIGITYLAEYISGELQLSWEHSAFRWLSFEEVMTGDFPEWMKKDFHLI